MLKKRAVHIAFKIAFIYFVISALWILSSDYFSELLSDDKESLIMIQNLKGIFFVLLSSAIIFLLIYRETKKQQTFINLLHNKNQLTSSIIKNMPFMDVFLFNKSMELLYYEGEEIKNLSLSSLPMEGLKNMKDIPLDNPALKKIVGGCSKILEGNTLREEVDYLGSYYELRGAPLYDDEGNVYAGLMLLVNITHQKLLTRDINEKMKEYEALYEEYLSQAETLKKNYDHLQQINEELTYSEKKYRTFIEQTNDGVYHFSFRKPLDTRKPAEQQLQTIFYDTWLSDCNDAFVQMYGARDKKELIGKNLLYFYGGDEKGNREVNLRFIKSGYKLLRDETVEFDADGNKVYFLNNTLGLTENNILTTIWGTQSDITKKKTYEDALVREKEKAQRNERKYIDLFNNLNDGVLLYEIGEDHLPGKIYEANDEICNLLQTDKNTLLGSLAQDYIEESESEKVKRRAEKHEEGEGQNFEVRLLTTSKKPVFTEVKTNVVKYGGKDLTLALIRDITKRKIMEQELEKERDKALESDRLKSAFLANMSHEIRTPMNSITGFSEMLNDDSITDEERMQYSAIIQSNSANLLRIIDDILNIAKIETQQVAYYYSSFPLNLLISEIAMHVNHIIQNSGKPVEVVTRKGFDDVLDIIYSDKERLYQVLINLVTNAEKFTSEGTITIAYEREGEKLWFTVEDTGIGIEPEVQQQVFERFRQGSDEYKTRKFGGTGLGLPIAKGIVEGMHGEITVKSVPGKGSAFSFYIPYHAKAPEKEK